MAFYVTLYTSREPIVPLWPLRLSPDLQLIRPRVPRSDCHVIASCWGLTRPMYSDTWWPWYLDSHDWSTFGHHPDPAMTIGDKTSRDRSKGVQISGPGQSTLIVPGNLLRLQLDNLNRSCDRMLNFIISDVLVLTLGGAIYNEWGFCKWCGLLLVW